VIRHLQFIAALLTLGASHLTPDAQRLTPDGSSQASDVRRQASPLSDLAEAMGVTDVQRTVLRVRLLPEGGRLEEEGEVTLLARRDGVAAVHLVLAEALEPDAFSVGGETVAREALSSRPYRWANAPARVWEIPLRQPPASGKSVTIGFRCAGSPDWPLDGRITPHLSWMLPQAAWYPRLGTGRVAEEDWGTLDLTITAPQGQVVVANGVPDQRDLPLSASGRGRAPARLEAGRLSASAREGGGVSTRHFLSRLPEAAFFVAGELSEVETAASNGVPLRWYSPRRTEASPLVEVKRLLGAQRERFGAFPHPRLTVLQLPEPWPAGESYAVAGAILLDTRPPGVARLAHELAHQWWGLSVQTPLLEGLATYAEWQVAPPTVPGGSYPEFAARHADRAVRDALWSFEEPQRRALAYDKLAAVLVMLEDQIGADRFTRVLREFQRRYAGRRTGVETFQTLARSVARQDLDAFFSQWLYGPGLPTLRLEGAEARREGKGYRLTLHLMQTTPPFRLLLPVAIDTASGKERRTVEFAGTGGPVEVEVPARPAAVTVDPDGRVLLNRRESTLRCEIR
jgi:hypothetical protein